MKYIQNYTFTIKILNNLIIFILIKYSFYLKWTLKCLIKLQFKKKCFEKIWSRRRFWYEITVVCDVTILKIIKCQVTSFRVLKVAKKKLLFTKYIAVIISLDKFVLNYTSKNLLNFYIFSYTFLYFWKLEKDSFIKVKVKLAN